LGKKEPHEATAVLDLWLVAFYDCVTDSLEPLLKSMNRCLYEISQSAWYCLIEPCRGVGWGTVRIETTTTPKWMRSMLILDECQCWMVGAFMLGKLLVLNP
jgi:hypothetical protein